MSLVSSYNDWSTLEEVVLGSAAGSVLPNLDVSLRHFFGVADGDGRERVSAARLRRIQEETEEDFDEVTTVLRQLGVVVRRPAPADHGTRLQLPGWETTMTHALMPRDCLLVVGSMIMEAPMPVRARYCETFPLRPLLHEYFRSGAFWVSAPKPRLPGETFQFSSPPQLLEEEPLFDAANVIRCGEDLFFNVSNTGNRMAAEWLRRVLGSEYRVHEVSICDDHVGTTIQLLRPGVLLANASRLTQSTIPEPLRSWKTIWFDDALDDGFAFGWPRASVWIGMNILSYDEETILVPNSQTGLMRLLEKEGFTVIPVPFRHGRTWGGGLHCCSLDVRRRGRRECYL